MFTHTFGNGCNNLRDQQFSTKFGALKHKKKLKNQKVKLTIIVFFMRGKK